jgi:predicted site-specific integrase-resolvase
MRVALYVRVSTDRQQQAQTIEQQVTQLHSYVAAHEGWTVAEEHVFRDDGASGAKLDRPGLTPYVTMRGGQRSTWSWSPRRIGWPATSCTRW